MSEGQKQWLLERVTAVLTCFADGTKLPPIIIFRGKRNPKHAGINTIKGQIDHPEQAGLPPGVLFSVNEEAYVYEEDMTGVWQESVKEYMRQQRCVGDDGGHNSLLLLDDYKVHKSVKEALQSNGLYMCRPYREAWRQWRNHSIFFWIDKWRITRGSATKSGG